MVKEEKVLATLIEIYNELYEVVKADGSNVIFNRKFEEKFQYSPDEIGKIFNMRKSDRKKATVTTRKVISEIGSKEQVKEYYEKTLVQYFSPETGEDEKKKILDSTTLSELNHFYVIIYNISLPKRWKKIDALYAIKDYFDSEIRTEDLTKTLR